MITNNGLAFHNSIIFNNGKVTHVYDHLTTFAQQKMFAQKNYHRAKITSGDISKALD